MRWLRTLYMGENAQKNKERIIGGIADGKILIGTYVIIVPESEGNQLEIIGANQLLQSYYKKHEPVIAGIASSKKEAYDLLIYITEKAIRETGKADLKAYLQEVEGVL